MNGPKLSKRVNYTAKGYTGCGRLLPEIFVRRPDHDRKKFSAAAVTLLKSNKVRPGGKF
jgi:hypothetical protein